MYLPKKRGTVTDGLCDLACPISILAGHKREARLATKHRLRASYQPQTAPRDCPSGCGKHEDSRAKPTHLLNDMCRSHSRRNLHPLRPMGPMNRHDPLPLSQTVRTFSPVAQNHSSCTPPPPCWSSPTFQSPDYRPDNDIRRSACPFPLRFHPHRPNAILLHRDTWLSGRYQQPLDRSFPNPSGQ